MYTTEYVTIPLRELLTRVQTFKYEGLRFVQMAAETTAQGMDLFYTFYDEVNDKAITLDIYDIDETSEVPQSRTCTSRRSATRTRRTTSTA